VIADCTSCDTLAAWGHLFELAGASNRVNGIFHLAGKTELKYLKELSEISNKHIIEGELCPKELAVCSIEEYLDTMKDTPPSFVMLFSSIAAILGGYGMGPYSAANRCMDIAAGRHAYDEKTKWFSVNWDDWSFEYTVEQTAAYTAKAAAKSMTPEEGCMVIDSLLLADAAPSQVLVSTTSLQPKMDEWLHQCARLQSLRQPTTPTAPNNSGKAGTQSMPTIVAQVFQDVLGLEAPPKGDEEFFELGGDSVSAGPLLRALKVASPKAKGLGIADIFSLQSVERIASSME